MNVVERNRRRRDDDGDEDAYFFKVRCLYVVYIVSFCVW